jgi:4-carboxymuconolactone decarboxylase
MDEQLPGHIQRFMTQQPDISRAFQELGRRVHETGPLVERERRLVKLGIAIGAGTEGGVHSAVRNCLADGLGAEDIRHAARLAITTVGWPHAMAALSWVEDVLDPSSARR